MANPWDRLTNESDEAWRAFLIYRNQALPRNKRNAYRAYASSPDAAKAGGQFSLWASENRWDERVRAYDQNMDQQAIEARLKEIADWQARRKRNREKVADIGESFLDRTVTLMRFPPVEQKLSDGRTIIMPADPKHGRQATQFARIGVAMLRDVGAIDAPPDAGEREAAEKEYLPEWLLECFRANGEQQADEGSP